MRASFADLLRESVSFSKVTTRGAARNFVREGPVTDVVRFQTLAICTKIILMSLVNFWSITTGYDVKYLLQVGIDKF